MLGQLSSVWPSECYRVASRHRCRSLQLDAVSILSWCTYATSSSGTRVGSILRDDVSLEAVLGQHHAASQHFEEALRDAVKEQLGVHFGRHKGRRLDLDLLQRLPAAELVRACRQARLPIAPEEDPRLLAAALHQWLHAPEVAATAAARPDSGSRGRAGGWDRPASLRHSLWLRQTQYGDDADGAVGDSVADSGAAANVVVRPPAGSSRPAVRRGLRGETGLLDGAAATGYGVTGETEAEVALREEAERQADVLFDAELQRRLQQAAAGAAEAALSPAAGESGVALRSTNVSAAGNTRSAEKPQQQARVAQPLSDSTAPGPSPQQPQMDHPEVQLQLQGRLHGHAVSGHEPSFLSTTNLLAATGSNAASHQPVNSPSGASPFRISGGGGRDEGSLLDLLPSSKGPPRPSEVVAAVRRSLLRAGYTSKDPTALRSLLLLSRGELLRLVEGFSGGGLDVAGQGREQLAARLLDMTACVGSSVSSDSNGGDIGTGSSARCDAAEILSKQTRTIPIQQPPEVETEVARTSGAPAAPVQAPGGDRRRVVTWLRQEMRVDGSAEEHEVWDDDERAALGDARRRQVLESARRRQQLMAAAARPEEIATWLVKARAQDVVLISSDLDLGSGDNAESPPTSTSTGSRTSYMVVATALSHRHAYACAEAVRYQIREKLEELASECNPGSGAANGRSTGSNSAAATSAMPGAPSVSGFNGADWLSLEAGRVQVHVLTPQARRYYRLEDLMAGASDNHYDSRGSGANIRRMDWGSAPAMDSPPRRSRIRLFGPLVDGERLPDTLETAKV
ncbi:hypothetical protein Vretimale_11757 [Volvox reticuliferus]|uniref:Uncharacterized protein n=1 Tax=Volvox reticuliferus TaxID=1737510 RepID=A0A8J4CZD8_9CHLO|nr:hypothetical protein Vretifemale_20235 [Volvox reticuliferus]GIM07693.1 hypothetical protein Vretimale_11757 [Volvox reticuliferus]